MRTTSSTALVEDLRAAVSTSVFIAHDNVEHAKGEGALSIATSSVPTPIGDVVTILYKFLVKFVGQQHETTVNIE